MKNILFFIILVSIFCLNSCNDNGTNDASSSAGKVTLSFGKPPASVAEIIATLTRRGAEDREMHLTVSDTGKSASGSFHEVPVGTWHLHVEALNDSGKVEYAGDTEIEVMPGQTTSVTLEMLATTGSIEINVTWGGTCSPVTDGLVSWWRFEDVANDVMGSNHGIPLAGGGVYAAGKVGKAISLNGGGYVRIPNSPTLTPSGSFTFDAWIYPTKDARGNLIAKWGDENQWSNQRSYAIEVLPGRNLSFGISDSAHQNDPAFHVLYSSGGKLSQYTWNHIACVYDQASGKRSIYINGSLAVSRTDSPITVLESAADLTIGLAFHAPGYAFPYPFSGRIDELCYYQRALSADEVKSIFKAGSHGKCR